MNYDTKIISAEELLEAAELLKRGEIVAFPTETVYGLGGRLFDEHAISNIFRVKGRPQDNPLIAHIAELADVERLAVDIPDSFYRLAEIFSPGPLTVILKKHPAVPVGACAHLESVAIRIPKHPLARRLIRLVGEPLVAPSANLSGKPSSTSVDHVLEDFRGKIAAVIEGGQCELGIESSVVSLLDENRPLLLRPGQITAPQLEAVLRKKIDIVSKINKGEAAVSPGMKYRHYAPRAPLKVFTDLRALTAHVATKPSKERMILSRNSSLSFPGGDSYALSSRELYALLRLSDQKNYDEIIVFCDEVLLQDHALMNRLFKAEFHDELSDDKSDHH